MVVSFASFAEGLRCRADEQPNDLAYRYLPQRGGAPAEMRFAELWTRAAACAGWLAEEVPPGERVILAFPSGLEFIIGFFGCLLARIVAVPLMMPRRASRRNASQAILADCAPRLVLTSRDVTQARPDLVSYFAETGLELATLDADLHRAFQPSTLPQPGDIAFLQYTSGSTSAPKGVVVNHANLLANSEMIRLALGASRRSTTVCWAPLYHDLGLVLNVAQSLYLGALCVLMAPVAFMHRPLSWLKAIQDHRAEIASGPNFAYDLCASRYRPAEAEGLDLSSWRHAMIGAEAVRAETLRRFAAAFAPHGFSAEVLHPAYGMAEATVLISGGRRAAQPVVRPVSREALKDGRVAAPAYPSDSIAFVGCGRALAGEKIEIVDPASCRRIEPGRIGEIWIAGPNVAQGYWRNPEATAAAFHAEIEGEDGHWLRTSDLGFLEQTGELFVTGRLKEMITIRGINHYPQDIEETVQNCHPALARHGGAAFAVVEGGDERLVIVQEIDRESRHRLALGEILGAIREAVATEHEIAAGDIVLIRPGTLPKTTSGKIQRTLTRELWRSGALAIVEPAVIHCPG